LSETLDLEAPPRRMAALDVGIVIDLDPAR